MCNARSLGKYPDNGISANLMVCAFFVSCGHVNNLKNQMIDIIKNRMAKFVVHQNIIVIEKRSAHRSY